MVIMMSNGKMIGCIINDETILCDQCTEDEKHCMKIANLTDRRKAVLITKRPKLTEKSPYHEVATRIADLVVDKQMKYGDSFGCAHRIIEELYPNGISKDQYKDLLVLVRIIDKIFRISKGDQGEESAWDDINGYSLLAATRKFIEEDTDIHE